jgi:hypothetical protein
MIDFFETSLLLSTIILSKMFILYFKVLIIEFLSKLSLLGLFALLNSCKVVNAFNPFQNRLSLAIWNPSSGVHFVVVAMAIPALAQTTLFWASVPLPEMMLVNIWADSSIVCPLGFHFVTRDLRQNPLDLALLPLNW